MVARMAGQKDFILGVMSHVSTYGFGTVVKSAPRDPEVTVVIIMAWLRADCYSWKRISLVPKIVTYQS